MLFNHLYESLLECLELEMCNFLRPGTLLLCPGCFEIEISIIMSQYIGTPLFVQLPQKCKKEDKPLETAITTTPFPSISNRRVHKERYTS